METREIKFRAWYGGFMFTDLAYITMSGGAMSKNPDMPLVNPIIMQYTGLKDKNGVEIYEGDVVKDSELTYIVRFGHCFIIEGTFHGWYLEHLERMDYNGPFSDGDTKVLSVLGNIYEQPHLLNL